MAQLVHFLEGCWWGYVAPNLWWIYGAGFLLLYYAPLAWSVGRSVCRHRPRFSPGRAAVGAAASLGMLLLIGWIISQERWVYFWDNGSYWYKTMEFQDALMAMPNGAVRWVPKSINQDDYNLLAAALLSVPLRLAGNGYRGFVLLTAGMFYLPAAGVLAWTLWTAAKRYYGIQPKFLYIYLFVLPFSGLLFPVLEGYVDAVALLPLAAALLLLTDRDLSRFEAGKNLCLGLSVLWAVLLRRYVAYGVVGLAVFGAVLWLTAPGGDYKGELKTRLLNALASAALPGALLLTVFRPYLLRSLLNDYSESYQAYKTTGVLGAFHLDFSYFGYFFVVLAVAGAVLSLKGKARSFSLGLTAWYLVTSLLFYRVQNMDTHHHYVVVLPLLSLAFLGGLKLWQMAEGKPALRRLGAGLLAAVSALNLAVGVAPRASKVVTQATGGLLVTTRTYQVKVRDDIPVLLELQDHLARLEQEGHSGVYCISNEAVNCDILQKLNAPVMELPYECCEVPQMDLRDGFWNCFFEADVILAADPGPYREGAQHLQWDLNRIMLEDNAFSRHYKVTQKFSLDWGTEVLVFVKQEPLDREAAEYVQQVYDEIFPQHRGNFHDVIQGYIDTLE